jgi:hypothetical protein
MSKQDLDPRVLEPIDEGKRSSLRKMVIGTAFVAPVVTSLPLSGLSINEANAYVSNGTS